MCACLPTHYISQRDSFYLSLQTQSLLSLLPQPGLTWLLTSSLGLHWASDPRSVITSLCIFSLWTNSSLYRSPSFNYSFESWPSGKFTSFLTMLHSLVFSVLCLPRFSEGERFPWPTPFLRGVQVGHHLLRNGSLISLSLCVNVSCIK